MKDFISSEKAIEILNSGKVVALPTETVYGLAAAVNNEGALEKIFSTKERPYFDPLIVHISNMDMLASLTLNPNPVMILLAKEFWPGPLTLVFNKNPKTVSDLITAGQSTVAIRWPKHPVIESIIKGLNIPLAAPSANPFKKTSPTKAEHVRHYFPELDIVDGGPCDVGVESTIVRINENVLEILRPGKITKSDLIHFLNVNKINLDVVERFNLEGPGSMKEHYQPSTPLYIFKNKDINYDLMDFKNKKVKTLVFPDNPFLFARVLYKTLIEESENTDILVLNWNHDEQDSNWVSIFNRLEKAAKVIL